MIDRVHFEKFKSLDDVTIELGRLTVLVGPNGCGKSSVLQGIHLLSQIGISRAYEHSHPWERLGMTFDGSWAPRRLVSGGAANLTLAMRESGGDELVLTFVVPATSDDGPARESLEFRVSVTGSGGTIFGSVPKAHLVGTLVGIVTSADKKKADDAKLVLDHARVKRFASVVYLHLDANQMTRTWIPEEASPPMRVDGSGLPSTLAWMKGAAEDELALITSDLARVVPGVKRIRTLRERVTNRRMEKVDIDGQPVWRPVDETLLGDRFEIEFDEGPPVPADLLSEGTVLALGLLTKLREPNRPRLVLLDDIDRGLHIEAQAKLVQVLRDLMKLDPDLQIVCTTHSPYLLDLFEPAEVRVLALDEKRHTRVHALPEHPEFERFRYGIQTGELWATLGDAWVAKDRP
jgi:predicted ATPase